MTRAGLKKKKINLNLSTTESDVTMLPPKQILFGGSINSEQAQVSRVLYNRFTFCPYIKTTQQPDVIHLIYMTGHSCSVSKTQTHTHAHTQGQWTESTRWKKHQPAEKQNKEKCVLILSAT